MRVMSGSTSTIDPAIALRLIELEATVVAQQAALEAEREQRVAVEAERDQLRDAYEALKIQVELAHRRLTIAKAPRYTTSMTASGETAELAPKPSGWLSRAPRFRGYRFDLTPGTEDSLKSSSGWWHWNRSGIRRELEGPDVSGSDGP